MCERRAAAARGEVHGQMRREVRPKVRRSPTACPYRLSALPPPPLPPPPSYDGRVEWGQERRGQVQNDARWTAHAIEEARRRRIAVWRHTVSATCGGQRLSCNREPVQREAFARATGASLTGVPCVVCPPSLRFAGSKRMPSKWACISDVSALSTHAGP